VVDIKHKGELKVRGVRNSFVLNVILIKSLDFWNYRSYPGKLDGFVAIKNEASNHWK